MRVGSLFAGIGGFDLAAERAGMTVAWHAENDEQANRVLEERWPKIPNHGDVHEIKLWGTERTASAVDVLAGGFPCQDYSVAGTRGGLAGDRGALWWEFHRLIVEGGPRWVIGENVPGILSSRGGRDFATIIDSLTELGYSVGWRVLDAQHFGLAQRRRRVFIVGHIGDSAASEVLALAEGSAGHPRPSREAGAIAAGEIARSLGAVGGGNDYGANKGTLIAEPLIVQQPFTANQRDEVRELDIAGSLDAKPGMKQQTFIAGSVDVRRLTPLECERLQGFPDGWTDIGQSDAARYRQLGNAVAVPVAEWIMRRIAESDPEGGNDE